MAHKLSDQELKELLDRFAKIPNLKKFKPKELKKLLGKHWYKGIEENFNDRKLKSYDDYNNLKQVSSQTHGIRGAFNKAKEVVPELVKSAFTGTPEVNELRSYYSPDVQTQLDKLITQGAPNLMQQTDFLKQQQQRSPLDNIYGGGASSILGALAPQYIQSVMGTNNPQFTPMGGNQQSNLSSLSPLLGLLAAQPQVTQGAQNFYHNVAPQGIQDLISGLTNKVGGLFTERK